MILFSHRSNPCLPPGKHTVRTLNPLDSVPEAFISGSESTGFRPKAFILKPESTGFRVPSQRFSGQSTGFWIRDECFSVRIHWIEDGNQHGGDGNEGFRGRTQPLEPRQSGTAGRNEARHQGIQQWTRRRSGLEGRSRFFDIRNDDPGGGSRPPPPGPHLSIGGRPPPAWRIAAVRRAF